MALMEGLKENMFAVNMSADEMEDNSVLMLD